jgi:hypothetical protein
VIAHPASDFLSSQVNLTKPLKGLTVMVNSQYNGWRMEEVWLDR